MQLFDISFYKMVNLEHLTTTNNKLKYNITLVI